MFSYWEQKTFSNYNTAIIGAGLAGLFTALYLKRKFPKELILILEGEMFPAASTKNAGFACMGSITELEDDLTYSSTEEVIALFEKRYKGLRMMRRELGDDKIAYKEKGSFELVHEKDISISEKIDKWNEQLYYIEKRPVFSIGDLSQTNFKGFSLMLKNELEGELDTGKLYQTLRERVRSLGVEIHYNSKVTHFEKGNLGHNIWLRNGFRLRSNRLVFCTNAFTKELIPNMDISPARGQVLITKPISDIPFKGIYHFDRGYYYFREIDGRVLLGGGRQLDLQGENTSDLGFNNLILSDLKEKLSDQILPRTSFEIDYSWSGIMGKLSSKSPLSKQLDESTYILAGFGGMGVALAPYMAQKFVEAIN